MPWGGYSIPANGNGGCDGRLRPRAVERARRGQPRSRAASLESPSMIPQNTPMSVYRSRRSNFASMIPVLLLLAFLPSAGRGAELVCAHGSSPFGPGTRWVRAVAETGIAVALRGWGQPRSFAGPAAAVDLF